MVAKQTGAPIWRAGSFVARNGNTRFGSDVDCLRNRVGACHFETESEEIGRRRCYCSAAQERAGVSEAVLVLSRTVSFSYGKKNMEKRFESDSGYQAAFS